MQVVALRPGYYDSLRAKGEVFEVPAGITGSWFLPTQIKAQEAQEAQEVQEVQEVTGGKSRKKKAAADDQA